MFKLDVSTNAEPLRLAIFAFTSLLHITSWTGCSSNTSAVSNSAAQEQTPQEQLDALPRDLLVCHQFVSQLCVAHNAVLTNIANDNQKTLDAVASQVSDVWTHPLRLRSSAVDRNYGYNGSDPSNSCEISTTTGLSKNSSYVCDIDIYLRAQYDQDIRESELTRANKYPVNDILTPVISQLFNTIDQNADLYAVGDNDIITINPAKTFDDLVLESVTAAFENNFERTVKTPSTYDIQLKDTGGGGTQAYEEFLTVDKTISFVADNLTTQAGESVSVELQKQTIIQNWATAIVTAIRNDIYSHNIDNSGTCSLQTSGWCAITERVLALGYDAAATKQQLKYRMTYILTQP